MKVNLISDTVTRPTKDMLAYMAAAKVGDDVFKEDPTVNALEEKVASMFGKEAALFFPSGTMANQTAIKLHTQPGEQIICDAYAHIYNYEGGGASFNSGVSCALIHGDQGRITAQEIAEKINPEDFYHSPRTAMVALENTTNKGGGAFYDQNTIEEIAELCKKEKLPLHLDGARLWNAITASQISPAFFGKHFSTLSVCMSKGLGAPVGSVLMGSKMQMQQALRIRKIFGGGMRQSGYLAAAAIYALDHHWEDLKTDHLRAKELGKVLEKSAWVKKVSPVSTNIVIFELVSTEAENTFTTQMKHADIHFIAMGGGKLRFVTHRDYTEDQHNYVLENLSKLNY